MIDCWSECWVVVRKRFVVGWELVKYRFGLGRFGEVAY